VSTIGAGGIFLTSLFYSALVSIMFHLICSSTKLAKIRNTPAVNGLVMYENFNWPYAANVNLLKCEVSHSTSVAAMFHPLY